MILLFNPQSNPTKKPILPKSILALAAVLEGRYEYRLLDGNRVEDSLNALCAAIEETKAPVLAMTVMSGPQVAQAAPLSKMLKQKYPALTIIWGGYFPTLHPAPVMESGLIDYAFRGHSELAFVAFLDSLAAGVPDLTQPGLVWFDSKEKRVVKNPLAPLPDINQLPRFPYHSLDVKSYLRPTFLGSRTISHHSSYGCPFQCNFCGVVNMVQGRYTAETAERTADVVTKLVTEYGANAIEFHDSNFFVQESRVAEFSERITPLNIKWWGFGRIDTMMKFSDETWRSMRKSGLDMVYLGAETGSMETLARMNKGGKQTPDQVLTLVTRMKQFDITPELSFVFGNPPDPANDISITMNFIRKIKQINPATEIIFYIYTPVPLDGELYAEAIKSGFAFPEKLDDWTDKRWQDFVMHRTSNLPWLPAHQISRIRNFQRVLNCAYPTTTDPRLTGLRRTVLKILGGWRYYLKFYAVPIDLKIVSRLLPYQRPETSGF